ncbi:MAG TPA: hypothetical protein VJU82_04100 [Acidobacteriaceae bacterium]|nr:hypothetical protein [Acidobacteriaceae bacterium]
MTAVVLVLAVRGEFGHQHARSGWLLPLDFILHGWPLIVANVAFYGYLCWLVFCFVRGTEGRERLFMAGWAAGILPLPLEYLGPL